MTRAHPHHRETPVEAVLESWGNPAPIPAPSNWWRGWEEQQPTSPAVRLDRAEEAFDQLNPDFGMPADNLDAVGQQAVRDRETGLALGTRAAVAAIDENHPRPRRPPGRGRSPRASRCPPQPRRPAAAGPAWPRTAGGSPPAH